MVLHAVVYALHGMMLDNMYVHFVRPRPQNSWQSQRYQNSQPARTSTVIHRQQWGFCSAWGHHESFWSAMWLPCAFESLVALDAGNILTVCG